MQRVKTSIVYSSELTLFIQNRVIDTYLHVSTFSASLVAQSVKNLPAVQETQVQSLDWEDPLEKEKASHSSFLALEAPWT